LQRHEYVVTGNGSKGEGIIFYLESNEEEKIITESIASLDEVGGG
jgi:hypothetical protein